jgi:membrane-bound metal-dependent hydrolase YbcI (DUF457 family)
MLGLLAGLLAAPFLAPEPRWLYLLLSGAFAILPDIDHKGSTINRLLNVTRAVPAVFKHRGFFHSVWPALGGGAALWTFATPTIGLAFLTGYLSHLVSDSLTRDGVNYLHPLLRFKVAGFMRTGALLESLVFLLATAAIAVLTLPRILG